MQTYVKGVIIVAVLGTLFFAGSQQVAFSQSCDPTLVIPRGSTWKYDESGADLGTAWKEPGFDDSAWKTGPAPLGFGESEVVTSAGAGVITLYLRKEFTIDDLAPVKSLVLLATYDDGFVAYLNGTEVARRSIVASPAFDTGAFLHEAQPWDREFDYLDLGPFLGELVAGTNVLAVELHNQSTGSSDLVWDGELQTGPDAGGSLLLAEATWKYEDTGTDLGTDWKEPGFDDSAWQSGAAPLGFGEDYITTTIATGAITNYFRHTFLLLSVDPATIAGLVLTGRVDDGFVAYLNGVEIAREQLADGTILFSTTGDSHEGGGFQYSDASAGVAGLKIGQNVLAVEVHNSSATSSDLVMDMALFYNTPCQNPIIVGQCDPAVVIQRGSTWKYDESGADLGTAWKEPGFDDSGFKSGGAPIGFGESEVVTPVVEDFLITLYLRKEFTIAEPVSVKSLVLLATYDDGFVAYLNGTEVARRSIVADPAFDTGAFLHEAQPWPGEFDFLDLSAFVGELVAGTNVLAVELHNQSTGSSDIVWDAQLQTDTDTIDSLVVDSGTWKYEDSSTDLGTAWKESGFDDSAWQTGTAPLGFGEDYVSTTITQGTAPTYYFRYSFTNDIDPTTLSGLVLNSQVDDGFAAYLNGVEIARERLPDGTISFATTASSHEGGGFQYSDASAGLASLVMGNNVLAVEVHNSSATGSDLVMDMVLLSRTCPGLTSVTDDRPSIPVTMSLHQNFPNPFNPSTTIHLDIAANQPSNQNISVEIYDLLGRKVKTLFDGTHSPGTLHLNWDATDDKGAAVATGVYIYRLRTGATDVARRMTLLR